MRTRHRFSLLLPLLGLAAACTVVEPAFVPSASPGLSGAVNVSSGAATGLRSILDTVVLSQSEGKDLLPILRTPDGGLVAQGIVWNSSNPDVVAIDPNTGHATGQSVGQAVVTATLQGNPAVSASLTVSVVESRTVSLIQVNPGTPAMHVGDLLQLIASVQLADGQVNGNVTWSSSDDTIATVNPTSGEVSALKPGKVTIVASYTVDPRYKALADVTIVAPSASLPPSPTPTPIIFQPGATPLPSAEATDTRATLAPTSMPLLPTPSLPAGNLVSDFGRLSLEDPMHDAQVKIASSSVEITAPNDNDFDFYWGFNAPRLLTTITGDFKIGLRIDDDPKLNYQAAGIVLIDRTSDPFKYYRLERANENGNNYIKTWFNPGTNSYTIDQSSPYSGTSVDLMIERDGNRITGSFKDPIDDTYSTAYSSSNIDLSRNLYVGIILINEHNDSDNTAMFSNLSLQSDISP